MTDKTKQVAIKEGTVVVDGGTMTANVVLCPVCSTTLVIPPYTGAEENVVACDTCGHAENCSCSDCACTASTHTGYAMTSPSYAESATTSHVSATTSSSGMSPSMVVTGIGDANMLANTANITWTSNGTTTTWPIIAPAPLTAQKALDHLMAEAGKRNSGKDETLLRQIADLIKQLGVEVTPPVVEAPTEEPVTESFVVNPVATSDNVVIQEGSINADEFVSLREAGAVFNDATREITITPIKPGWGNKRDKFWYPREALKEAVSGGVFGKNVKMYANHPTKTGEKDQPERSVWDWVSTIKETWWDDKNGVPKSRIKVYDDRLWERAKAAPDEIAFSILGRGKSRRGRVENEEARIVESLVKIQSVDWVTEAGAGGAIDSFAESAHEEFEMSLEKLTAEQLREARPDLVEALMAAKTESTEETPAVETELPSAEAPVVEAATAETPAVEAVPAVEETPAAPAEEAPAAEAALVEETPTVEAPAEEAPVAESAVETVSKADFEALKSELDAMKAEREEIKTREAASEARAAALKVVDEEISTSDLPRVAKDAVRDRFTESTLGNGYIYSDRESLKAAISKELDVQERIVDSITGKKRSKVVGLGAAPEDAPSTSVRESVAASLMARFGTSNAPEEGAGSAGDNETVEAPVAAPVKESSETIQESIAKRLLS